MAIIFKILAKILKIMAKILFNAYAVVCQYVAFLLLKLVAQISQITQILIRQRIMGLSPRKGIRMFFLQKKRICEICGICAT